MMRMGDEWLLTSQRAGFHEPTATLVIADVHLGYGQARQTRGDAVPGRFVATDLAPLLELIPLGARRLLIAGDLFESGYSVELGQQLATWCQRVGVELLGLVPGNHDRIGQSQPGLPVYPEGFRLGDWLIRHGDGAIPAEPLVQGHEHPCLRLSGRVQAPCYLVSERRLILPAFSREAAGVSVLLDPRWRGFECAAIVGREVLNFGLAGTLGQRLAQLH